MKIQVIKNILKEINEEAVVVTTSGCSYIALKNTFKFKQDYLQIESLKNYDDVGGMVFRSTFIDYKSIASLEGILKEEMEL